jgi:hypothetical protein
VGERSILSVFISRTWALIGDENALSLILPAKMVKNIYDWNDFV